MNIQHWINNSIKKLYFSDNPRYEARLLLSHVTKCTYTFIVQLDNIFLTNKQYQYLNNLIDRRSLGEPIAYIIEEKEFWSLSLYVSYDTLIPRPDTEILVEKALSKIYNHACDILDLGTGSGAIALALASTCTNCRIIGVDKSDKSLEVAKINASKFNLTNVVFYHSDWFSNINQKFNIIISNPPYISAKEIQSLQQDILFEPLDALIANEDGLSEIKNIIKMARYYLFFGGWLLIEHSWKQKLAVQDLFKKYNFSEVQSYQDYGGNDRVTIGKNIIEYSKIL